MATVFSVSLNLLNDTDAEAEAFVESVMSLQRLTIVNTPTENGRKRNLSLPNNVSGSIVKKAKGSCGLTDEDGNSDPEDRDSSVSEICAVNHIVGALENGCINRCANLPLGTLCLQKLECTMIQILVLSKWLQSYLPICI